MEVESGGGEGGLRGRTWVTIQRKAAVRPRRGEERREEQGRCRGRRIRYQRKYWDG